jgi:hypothetical protein
MPRIHKDEAPILVDAPLIQGRYAELEDYTVSFQTFPQEADGAPVFRGLPDDRCQCPHWGIMRSGRLTLRYADREETYNVGDAYYALPGHTPAVAAGTETVDFSPTKLLQETMAVVGANMTAMDGAR